MWERCEATADAALGVYLHLERLGAQGEVMHTDDTCVRILSCMKEDQEEKGRETNTSGIVVKVGELKIAFYMSGRRHAGENFADLLKKRQAGIKKPFQTPSYKLPPAHQCLCESLRGCRPAEFGVAG